MPSVLLKGHDKHSRTRSEGSGNMVLLCLLIEKKISKSLTFRKKKSLAIAVEMDFSDINYDYADPKFILTQNNCYMY